jgi:hypothetical protein
MIDILRRNFVVVRPCGFDREVTTPPVRVLKLETKNILPREIKRPPPYELMILPYPRGRSLQSKINDLDVLPAVHAINVVLNPFIRPYSWGNDSSSSAGDERETPALNA